MNISYKTALISTLVAIVIAGWFVMVASAATPPSTVPQGGTGWGGWVAGTIPIGAGTGVDALRFATSSAFTFATSTSRLTVTYASTTALSATTLCLTGDTCKTAWPTGTVSSIATNNGITGGTITTTGTIGLATQNANTVLGNITGSTGVPTGIATSSQLFTGTQGQLVYFNAVNSIFGTSTLFINTNQFVGVASTTPWGQFSVEQGTEAISFVVTNTGSSSPSLSVNGVNGNGRVGIGTSSPFAQLSVASGAILNVENNPATSTSQAVDWRNGNQQLFKYGTSGITVSFTGAVNGQKLIMVTCAPDVGTMGTITWPAGIRWAGGTTPSQTTTAQHCDVYSFLATQATSTTSGATVYFGNQSANF